MRSLSSQREPAEARFIPGPTMTEISFGTAMAAQNNARAISRSPFHLTRHVLPWHIMASLFWIAALGCASAVAWAAQPFGVDLDGRPVHRLAPPGSRAVVLFFVASDCPISNRYIPEIERLDGEFSSAGVHLWWVYPDPEDTPDVIRQHHGKFDIHGATVLDAQHRLTAMAHATVTPEVAVFVPEAGALREVYRGRIDDRYLSLGQERPSAHEHDLENALRAVISNRSVPPPGGPPVGCSIVPRSAP